MSVEPWMLAWPRSARIPPPGRPTLPSSNWSMAAVLMCCTPVVCWVQPTAYTKAVVRSRPLLATRVPAIVAKSAAEMPHTCSTISGVYRAKCRLSTWNTQRGWVSVGSVSGEGGAAAPPDPCASPRPASRIRASTSCFRPRAPLAGAGVKPW